MTRYAFYGRVLPEVRRVSLPEPYQVVFDDPERIQALMEISIQDGEIEIICTTQSEDATDIEDAAVRSFDVCAGLVDILAFGRAEALSVQIDKGEWDGVIRPLVLSHKKIERIGSEWAAPAGFDIAASFVMKDVELRLALRDLVSSLSTLNYSAIAAGRAVEAIRHRIAPAAASEGEAWAMLREHLRLERSYLQPLTDASRKPRHGQRAISNEERHIQHDITVRAWTVMHRYLRYLKRGLAEPLPEAEYPYLT